MENTIKISVVSPVYQSENIIDELVKRITQELVKITDNFEVILVEDGSTDKSWNSIENICKKDHRIKGIKLSRNFGQHYAITAGLEFAGGDYIVLMDCDLQDDPKNIMFLYEHIVKGYEIVFTKRIERKHSFTKSITAKIYNWLFVLFSNRDYDVNFGSLTMISKKAKIEFLKLKDYDRLYIQLLRWMGFKSCVINVTHNRRFEGKSTYTFSKLLKMAIQGWTSYSDRLLRLSIYFGFSLSVVSFLSIIYIIFMYFYSGFQPGWASVIVTILFSTGLILTSIGITGIYIGKIFQQMKQRPLYVIDEKLNIT